MRLGLRLHGSALRSSSLALLRHTLRAARCGAMRVVRAAHVMRAVRVLRAAHAMHAMRTVCVVYAVYAVHASYAEEKEPKWLHLDAKLARQQRIAQSAQRARGGENNN